MEIQSGTISTAGGLRFTFSSSPIGQLVASSITIGQNAITGAGDLLLPGGSPTTVDFELTRQTRD